MNPSTASDPAPLSGKPSSPRRRGGRVPAILGLLPFLIFALAFMIAPAGILMIGSFQDAAGEFTLANFANLARPNTGILSAYGVTLKISLFSAIGGGFLGFLMAVAVTSGGLPKSVRFFLNTFCGVASNFAGVPLAFAFISTLGRVGLLTILIKNIFGFGIYDSGFNLYGFWGLCLTYIYFQAPLMVLVIMPALDGMKREWREASQTLGAKGRQYWLHVALPVLAPSLLGALILLFGNAFGAYATAFALTGGSLNLIPILIGIQIRGDVLHDPNLGYALAVGMVFIMLLCILLHGMLSRRVSRWTQ
jgi:putative spermidine/putrescine transport system permease protein